MATVYVVCSAVDQAFVDDQLLPDLPQRGLDRWMCGRHLGTAGQPATAAAVAGAMRACAAIVIVVSSELAASAFAVDEVKAAGASGRPVVAVQTSAMTDADWRRLPARLRNMAIVDWALEGDAEARRLLTALLPTDVGGAADSSASLPGEAIRWRETRFSEALLRATRQHDHAAMGALVEAFVAHAARRGEPYPAERARKDLTALRQERAFELLCRHAEAAIAGGTQDASVRRLYAQGLIELQRFEQALAVLEAIIGDPHTSTAEVFEAWGLVGRVHKQRYVDGGGSAEWRAAQLLKAIAAYADVHERDASKIWHGVNAASCIRRAVRDGITGVDPARAQRVAGQVLAVIDALPQPLEVWDAASRVEALLALERHDEAGRALDVYLEHPEMTAFEVFSTHRQFDQVLQLGAHPRGAGLLQRLKDTVERYRAASMAGREAPIARSAASESITTTAQPLPVLRPLLIRVGTAAWAPGAIADLVVRARLGTVLTARGSDRSVRELLADPGVISVEESRPAGAMECDRSMPFIRLAAEYAGAGGAFRETGDAALIAVIDDGIDVLHEAFLDANGNSRIVGIWDQNTTGTPPPGFDYGHFHDAAAVARYVAAQQVPPNLARNEDGHGTHVASIAAGRAAGAFAGGVAPDAKLLIVISGGAGPIGYSQTHVEALAFIEAVAQQFALPVVVNLSQGMNAGAHDGKSPLEVAFDAFSGSGSAPGRVIVKSAGNERAKGGHARVTLLDGQVEKLVWRRAAGADPVERVELWWNANDTMRMRLGNPSGQWSEWVGAGAAPKAAGTFEQGGPYTMTFVRRHVDNGDSLLVLDLGSSSMPAAAGDWQLEIWCIRAPENRTVHAWIERTGGVPSGFTSFDDPEVTLSIPGTAASVIAVGAIDASMPLRLGDFSSFGPTRDGQRKPLICAPGVGVRAARGGTADRTVVKNGTSMAAPHVTGAIALLLSRAAKSNLRLAANQIGAALRGKTQNYSGQWDRGQGYGVLDIAALLGTLDE